MLDNKFALIDLKCSYKYIHMHQSTPTYKYRHYNLRALYKPNPNFNVNKMGKQGGSEYDVTSCKNLYYSYVFVSSGITMTEQHYVAKACNSIK